MDRNRSPRLRLTRLAICTRLAGCLHWVEKSCGVDSCCRARLRIRAAGSKFLATTQAIMSSNPSGLPRLRYEAHTHELCLTNGCRIARKGSSGKPLNRIITTASHGAKQVHRLSSLMKIAESYFNFCYKECLEITALFIFSGNLDGKNCLAV